MMLIMIVNLMFTTTLLKKLPVLGDIKKGITDQAPYLSATSTRPAVGRPPFVSGDVIEWSCLQG